MREKRVDREALGDRWPFTVDDGVLINKSGAIIFKHGGQEYGLNGEALAQGYAHIEPIWKKSAEVPDCMVGKSEMKVSLIEVINLGLNL